MATINYDGEEWEVIAEADSPDALKQVTPSRADLPAGTIGLVKVSIPWYAGGGLGAKVFDLAGAEQTIGNYLAPAHCEILDCYEEGGKGYIKFRVEGSPVVPILIALALGVLGIGVIGAIVVAVRSPSFFDPAAWGEALIPIGLIAVGGLILLQGGNHGEKSRIKRR